MSHHDRPDPTSSPVTRRMARRLGWTLGFSVVRGAGYAAGTTLASAVVWWLTNR